MLRKTKVIQSKNIENVTFNYAKSQLISFGKELLRKELAFWNLFDKIHEDFRIDEEKNLHAQAARVVQLIITLYSRIL